MAVIDPVPQVAAPGVKRNLWETLTESDTAEALELGDTDTLASCVQIVGTFGGATITIQGSNDGTNWANLEDLQGNALSFTSAAIADFSTAAAYIRPNATGGSSQDLDIYLTTRG